MYVKQFAALVNIVLATPYLNGWFVLCFGGLSTPTSWGDAATDHDFVLSMDVDAGLTMLHYF